MTTMSTDQTPDETAATHLQALENRALLLTEAAISAFILAQALQTRVILITAGQQSLYRLKETIMGAELDEYSAGNLKVEEALMTAIDAFDKMLSLLMSYTYRKGADKNRDAFKLLEICKKGLELLKGMHKAEAAVEKSLANIENKAADADRETVVDERQRLRESLEAVKDGLRRVVGRQMGEITAGVCRLIGNVKEFWYGEKTGDEESTTDKEAGGWRAQAREHKPVLEAVTVEKQGRERELGEQIWAFEGVKVDYDEDPECGKMYRELEDKLEPPKGEKADEGTGNGDGQRVTL